MTNVLLSGRVTDVTEVGAALPMELTLTNNGAAPLRSPTLTVASDTYFARQTLPLEDVVVPPYGSAVIRAVLKTIEGVGPRSFRGRVMIRVNEDPPQAVDIPWFILTKGLTTKVQNETGPWLNILVCGVAGSGKSSLINKLLTLFSSSPVPLTVVPVGSGRDHITKELRVYPIREAHVNLVDLWGLDYSNFTAEELELVLEGRWSHRWAMGTVPSEDAIAAGDATAHRRRIHAAVMSVSQMDLSRPTAERQRMTDFARRLRSLESLAVVSQVDMTSPQLDWRRSEDAPWDPLRRCVSEALCTPACDVYFNVNYAQDRCRDFDMDRQAFLMLEQLISRGCKFQQKHNGSQTQPHNVYRSTYELTRRGVPAHSGHGGSQPSPAPRPVERPTTECAVCMEMPLTHCVLPCGHTYCEGCARGQAQCSFCRRPVQGVQRIYF